MIVSMCYCYIVIGYNLPFLLFASAQKQRFFDVNIMLIDSNKYNYLET